MLTVKELIDFLATQPSDAVVSVFETNVAGICVHREAMQHNAFILTESPELVSITCQAGDVLFIDD